MKMLLIVAMLAASALGQGINTATSGIVCFRYDYNSEGQLVSIPMSCDKFPNTPDVSDWKPQQDAKTWEELTGKPAGFWTFRFKYDAWPTHDRYNYPPLRKNKQVLLSKVFVVEHVGLLVSFVVDNRVTHNAREHWDVELPGILGETAFDYTMSRYFTKAMSVEGAVYGMVHYSLDAAGLFVHKSK